MDKTVSGGEIKGEGGNLMEGGERGMKKKKNSFGRDRRSDTVVTEERIVR